MHAIGSGIMGDSEYLHEISALNTTSQYIYNVSRPKLDWGTVYVANIFWPNMYK